MLTRAIVFAMGCGAVLSGCSAAQPRAGAERTQEIIDNLIQAGFPDDDIMTVGDLVYVGRDAEVPLEASREMVTVDGATTDEQYRTTNLVSVALRVICINGAVLTGTLSQGLNAAIANYNALALSFRMVRTSGSVTGCDAVITVRLTSGTGGSSGFPSGGRPFNAINIGSGLASFDVNTIEHVFTHELGHCLGLRHSDFFNRSISCGGAATNEGNGGVGAILIPGTPSGATVGGSVMNSCFRALETGEFSPSDIAALRALY